MNWTDVAQLADLKLDLPRFQQQLAALIQKLGISPQAFLIDHISVRCHQNATAARWYEGFSLCGRILNETEINGRKNALFDLDSPLTVDGMSIDCVELPWPGERRYPYEGWEHIEMVLPGDASSLYSRALALLADEALASPEIKIKQSQPRGTGEGLANPTLAVSDGKVTIKFHPDTLRAIVASERQ